MKKTLLSLLTLIALGSAQAQENVYSYGFSGVTADLTTAGWTRTNQSASPNPTAFWTIPTYTPVVVNTNATPPIQGNAFGDVAYANGQTSPVPNGQAGGGNSFVLVNYQSTQATAGATISNWLITPDITVQDGDIVTFYSRKGTSGTTDYPDRLELRMSTAAPTVVPVGPTGVGSFTTLGVSVNPNLVGGFVYPKVWTQYTYVVSGVPTATAVKFGFRYFVTQGGPVGTNSDIIGIDTFSVDRPTAGVSEFFKNNFSVYPNPASNVINLSSATTTINAVQLTDINGRIVKSMNLSNVAEAQIDISDLNSGMYFLKIKSDLGEGTTKIMKN